MIIKTEKGCKIKTVGDPHIGREFKIGTPLHRRGEREQMQRTQFALELCEPDVDINVMMGDVFDKMIVSPNDILFVYDMYLNAMEMNPNTFYVLLRGNHDVSRSKDTHSSFDILREMLDHYPNVLVVEDTPLLYTNQNNENFLFCGYDAFTSAKDMINNMELPSAITWFEAVFGHWDVEKFGDEDHNLIPLEELSDLTDLVVTGHIHTPKSFFVWPDLGFKRTDEDIYPTQKRCMEVILTGSLQPFSHAEDPNELLYVTRTIEEYEKDTSLYKDKFLRLFLRPDEDLPADIDALNITYKVIDPDREEQNEELKVTMSDNFDLKSIFMEVMDSFDVDKDMKDEMWQLIVESSRDVE